MIVKFDDFVKIEGEDWKQMNKPYSRYCISNMGRILGIDGKKLVKTRHPGASANTLVADLCKDVTNQHSSISLAKEVLNYFYRPQELDEVPWHKDFDMDNCKIENLTRFKLGTPFFYKDGYIYKQANGYNKNIYCAGLVLKEYNGVVVSIQSNGYVKYLSQFTSGDNRRGDKRVGCENGQNQFVSILMCSAFHGIIPALNYEAHHKDTDFLNNLPGNLEWQKKGKEHAKAAKESGIISKRVPVKTHVYGIPMTESELLNNKDIYGEWKDVNVVDGHTFNRYKASTKGFVAKNAGKNGLKDKWFVSKGCLITRVKRYFVKWLDINKKYNVLPVSRIIANVFIPNPENKPKVDHINTITTDNSVTNLRWATSKENNMNKDIKGEKHPGAKLTEVQAQSIIADEYEARLLGRRINQTEYGKKFGVSNFCIFHVINGDNWPHLNRPWLATNNSLNPIV